MKLTEKERGFIDWCIQQHIDVNQRYDGELYSVHLKYVANQAKRYIELLRPCLLPIINDGRSVPYAEDVVDKAAHLASYSHDILEDTLNTYNDLYKQIYEFSSKTLATLVAEAVYCVTDEKGRNRGERKNAKYYKELRENPFAVYIKLCDIMANTLYSRLLGSSMYEKYREEWPKVKKNLATESNYKYFGPMFDYLDNI